MFTVLKRNLAFAIVAITVVGGGAIAYANGAPARPTLEPSSALAAQESAQEDPPPADNGEGATPARPRREIRKHRGAHGPLGRAIHGDLIVRTEDGTFANVTFDKGILSAVSEGELTLKRADGVDVTVKLDDNTQYKGVENAGGLEVAKHVIVRSKQGSATDVGQRPGDRSPADRSPADRIPADA